MTLFNSRLAPIMVAFSGLVLVAGCGSDADSATAETSPSPAATTAVGECPVTISDNWVKAAESGMTAEFGLLTNPSDADVTIVGGSTPAAAKVELHEVTDGVMSEIDGGLVVPAGGTLTMEPGGYHVMLMQLTGPVAAGDEVTTVLECDNGGSFEFVSVAKEYAGGNENYEGDGMESGMSDGMDGDSSDMPMTDESQPATP